MFALPALEASAFVGFVFPGEIAVLLGGVLAFEHRIPLPAAIGAAVAGAVIGDAAGYLIGRLWGRRLLRGTVGKLPVIRHHLDRSLDRAEAYVRRRQGSAVFFGRFTTALRVLVPGLAGMSEIPFPTFLVYNAGGGVLWGTGFVFLGYIAGAGYRHAEKVAGKIGLILLGLIVIGLVLHRVVRRFGRFRAIGERLMATPPLVWIQRRFARQMAWTRRRMDPASPTGFWLTFTVAAGALAAWAFGGLTQDVVGHDEVALLDPRVESFVTAHRTGSLTSVMKAVTWLGSTAVLIPLAVALAGSFLLRRRDWRPGALIALTLSGAVGLYDIVKPAVGRPRPPVALWIGHYTGWAFPSGHATQSLAFYGMVSLILGAGRGAKVKAWLWAGAVVVVLVVGASRLYLGGHWLSDVLGGWALGAMWLALVVALVLVFPGAGRGHRTPLGIVDGGHGRGARPPRRAAA